MGIYEAPVGDARVKHEGNGTVHVYVPQRHGLNRTLCGKVVSGLVWWRGMQVTSDPPAFAAEPSITCDACLAKLND